MTQQGESILHIRPTSKPHEKLQAFIGELGVIAGGRKRVDEKTFRRTIRECVRMIEHRIGAMHAFLTAVADDVGMDPQDLRSLASKAPDRFYPPRGTIRVHSAADRAEMPPPAMRKRILKSAHTYLRRRFT